jgi:hypothetical protein
MKTTLGTVEAEISMDLGRGKRWLKLRIWVGSKLIILGVFIMNGRKE